MPAEGPSGASLRTERWRIERVFHRRGQAGVFNRLHDVPGSREVSPEALEAFLAIGYVPGNATLFTDITCLPGGRQLKVHEQGWDVLNADVVGSAKLKGELSAETRPALARRMERLLREAVARSYTPSADIVVPLSGGMDSRALLAALLECRPAAKINTYTHGLPGASDYEIGNLVARTFGTRHISMNLENFEFTTERLVETARITDSNTDLVQPIIWTWARELFGETAEYWVGYTGDGIGGSHYRPPGGSVEQAAEAYVSEELCLDWFERQPASRFVGLVERTAKGRDVLSPKEAVWFENHVERYTAHHIYMAGLKYQSPFMDEALCDFMFSLPDHEREGKRLFNEVVPAMFPAAFRLPTKDYGFELAGQPLKNLAWRVDQTARKALWRKKPGLVRHPKISYLDFAWALRDRPDVRRVAVECLDVVRRSGLVDRHRLDHLWDSHQSGRTSHSATLTLLVSLGAMLSAR
jgi:hypothetical protein